MVIAIDIDDTITANVPFFVFLSQAAVAAGHTVLIVTFREDAASTEADLRGWGIHYTHLITSTLEAHLEHGVDEWKAAVCREYGADVIFDDMPHVLKHMDFGVTRFLIKG